MLKEADDPESKNNRRNTFSLPLVSNVVAGVIAVALVLVITSGIEKELKSRAP